MAQFFNIGLQVVIYDKLVFRFAKRKLLIKVARKAPISCPIMNPGRFVGLIPAKLSVSERATVIAGFAKLVEDVHQYPATIAKATAIGTDFGACFIAPKIAKTRVNVATASAIIFEIPLRSFVPI